MVPRSPATGLVPSGGLASSSGPSSTAPLSSFPSQSGVAASSRVETVRRFAREWGMSSAVACQLANCHRPSSQRLSTPLVGLSALVSFEGAYGVLSFGGEDRGFSFVFTS